MKSVPSTGVSGGRHSHSVGIQHIMAGTLEATDLVITWTQTHSQCPSWFAKPGTIINDDDAIGLVLLEIWDLPLLVPYGAFSVTAMQLNFWFT